MSARNLAAVASIFGAPVEGVRAQYLANAVTLDAMAERAGDGRYRGKSAAEWRALATDYRERAACA